MREQLRSAPRITLGVVLMLCLLPVTVLPQLKQARRTSDAARHSEEAASVFKEIMQVPDKAIPKELLEKAEAIAVFPGVVKAAFIFGGRGGQGVVSRRTTHGWSAPAFFNIGGGSFGPQIGAQATDYVLLIINHDGLRGLLEDRFEFGGEASVAAGPVGRSASAATNATLDAALLAYSRTKGAFIGASLKGAFISPDNDLNEAFYGEKARELLSQNDMSARAIPRTVEIFPETLVRYSRQQSNHVWSDNRPHPEMSNSTAESQLTRSTAQIAKEVKHELLLLPYYNVFDWLEFQVEPDGTVILRGQVLAPPDTKSRAEAAVKDIEGVTKVVNQIEILPVSPNDQRLREALYHAIYSGPLFRYALGSLNTIHIIVKNGRATLKGEVDSSFDRQLAYTRARGVTGVFAVNNDLVVRNEKPR